MRTYDEPETDRASDTEITLGTSSILGIFIGLALICGIFFGFGYSLGRTHTPRASAAAQRLVEASNLLAQEPLAIQLRYLQTLNDIGTEKNTTIVFPLPVEFLSLLGKAVPGLNPNLAIKPDQKPE